VNDNDESKIMESVYMSAAQYEIQKLRTAANCESAMIGMRSALSRCHRVIRSKRLPSSSRTASMRTRRPSRSLAEQPRTSSIDQGRRQRHGIARGVWYWSLELLDGRDRRCGVSVRPDCGSPGNRSSRTVPSGTPPALNFAALPS
jgi:hypothetical protein